MGFHVRSDMIRTMFCHCAILAESGVALMTLARSFLAETSPGPWTLDSSIELVRRYGVQCVGEVFSLDLSRA